MAVGKIINVRVSGGSPDWTSVSAAESNENADYTGGTTDSVSIGGRTYTNIAVHIICDPAGGTDTTSVELFGSTAGWVLDSTHRLLISTISSAWPTDSSDFKPGGGLYKIGVNGPSYRVFGVTAALHPYVIVAGLEINQTNGTSTASCVREDTNTTAGPGVGNIYDACVFQNQSTNSGAHGLMVVERGCRAYQCYIEAAGGDGVSFGPGGAQYNNEFIGNLVTGCGGNGFDTSGTSAYIDMNNNVCYNNTGDDWNGADTYRTEVGNYSQDATSPTVAGRSTITSADFVNAGTDWTPASGSDIEDGGDDMVTDGFFADRVDAVGATRPTGDTWAAGPLERQAGAAVAPLVGRHLQNMMSN